MPAATVSEFYRGKQKNLGRTVVTDIIVGIFMMILSVACGVAYSVILHVSSIQRKRNKRNFVIAFERICADYLLTRNHPNQLLKSK